MQDEDATHSSFPQLYMVSPVVKAMRVPVIRNPSQGNDVLMYLKADTPVNVLSRSELWLRIELPENRAGYIQSAYARPATTDELKVAQSKPSVNALAGKQGAISIDGATAGMSMTGQRGPNFQSAFNWFKVAGGCFFLFLLIGVLETNRCNQIGAQCSQQDPIAVIGVILLFASLVLLVIGILVAIMSIVESRKTR